MGTLNAAGEATNVVGVDVPSQVAVAEADALEQAEMLKLITPAFPEYKLPPLVLTGFGASVTVQLGGATTVIVNVVVVCALALNAANIKNAIANSFFIFFLR